MAQACSLNRKLRPTACHAVLGAWATPAAGKAGHVLVASELKILVGKEDASKTSAD